MTRAEALSSVAISRGWDLRTPRVRKFSTWMRMPDQRYHADLSAPRCLAKHRDYLIIQSGSSFQP